MRVRPRRALRAASSSGANASQRISYCLLEGQRSDGPGFHEREANVTRTRRRATRFRTALARELREAHASRSSILKDQSLQQLPVDETPPASVHAVSEDLIEQCCVAQSASVS